MTAKRYQSMTAIGGCLAVVLLAGCETFWAAQRPGPPTIGSLSDPVWQAQERNAEMSDFVIYQHEFQRDSGRLTTDGEDHVKQIAARLLRGQDAVVVVEQSMTTARPDTEFQYPVHPNVELDLKRREVVVLALEKMNIADASDRVMVAPALTPGFTGNEAEAAYQQGMNSSTSNQGFYGGFGGFMFGGGGFF
jgi:hypothetical protein